MRTRKLILRALEPIVRELHRGDPAPVNGKASRNGEDRALEAQLDALREQNAALVAQVEEQGREIVRLETYRTNINREVEHIAEQLSLAQGVIDAIPIPTAMVDEHGFVSELNDNARELLGLAPGALPQGLKDNEIFGWGEVSLAAESIAGGKRKLDIRRTIRTPTGATHHLQVNVAPRITPRGDIKGAFILCNDITALTLITNELIESGDRVIEVHASAAEILAASQEQAATAAQQAATVSNITTTATELASSAKAVADSNRAVASSIVQLLMSSRQGQDTLNRSLERLELLKKMTTENGDQLRGLGEKSKQIDKVVDFISKVATQTKLIAFNAAIEAARAGEAGRGFSVVASEVKSLAESVEASSEEIRSMVGDIKNATNSTILTAEGQHKLTEKVAYDSKESNDAFVSIVNELENFAERAAVISAAADQQNDATLYLTQSMEQVSVSANHSADSAEQTIEAVSELTEFARRLSETLYRAKMEA